MQLCYKNFIVINNKLNELSKYNRNHLEYKIPYNNQKDITLMLLNYADISCLNKKELQIYKDNITKLTYDCKTSLKEVTVNDDYKEQWELNNPNCVNRKRWEKIAYKICTKYQIQIDITKTDLMCNIAFDIVRNVINCEVLTTLSLHQKLCELNVVVNRTKEECETDYKLLIESYPHCNLTKKEYITLVNNNYSYEMISNTYKHNLKFEIDSKGNIKLISPIYSYSLPEELRFKEVVIDREKNSLVLLTKQLNDYKINNNIKNLILNGKYYI